MVVPLVADLSHHNWDNGMNPDFALAKQSGLVGVICKASQGAGFKDPRYRQMRQLAKAAGLKWGAYHFGTNANVQDQLANFIAQADLVGDDIAVLDFEENEQSPSNTMDLRKAVDFMVGFETRIGKRPRIYTGPFMYKLFGKNAVPDLENYDVWWARYHTEPELHPTWNRYWLWQYTDGHNGPKPHKIDGLGFCDLNHFNGSPEELIANW